MTTFIRTVVSVAKFFSLCPKLSIAPGHKGAHPPFVSLWQERTVLWVASESVSSQWWPFRCVR